MKRDDYTEMQLIKQDVEYIKKEVGEISGLLKNDYVTRSDFEPVRKIVYGMVGVILITVVGAVLALVVVN